MGDHPRSGVDVDRPSQSVRPEGPDTSHRSSVDGSHLGLKPEQGTSSLGATRTATYECRRTLGVTSRTSVSSSPPLLVAIDKSGLTVVISPLPRYTDGRPREDGGLNRCVGSPVYSPPGPRRTLGKEKRKPGLSVGLDAVSLVDTSVWGGSKSLVGSPENGHRNEGQRPRGTGKVRLPQGPLRTTVPRT